MCENEFENKISSIAEILNLVKSSNFFSANKNVTIHNYVLKSITLNSILLPFKLRIFTHRNNITTLEDLLNTEVNRILNCRNLGTRTIEKSSEMIIDYLYEIEDCILNQDCEINDHYKHDIVRYFPLLNGTFRTSRLHFNLIFKELSWINIPKEIKNYIKEKSNVQVVNDLLNISYNEILIQRNVGRQTIRKLQIEIIDKFNLKKVIFLPELKRYGLIKYKVNTLRLISDFVLPIFVFLI